MLSLVKNYVGTNLTFYHVKVKIRRRKHKKIKIQRNYYYKNMGVHYESTYLENLSVLGKQGASPRHFLWNIRFVRLKESKQNNGGLFIFFIALVASFGVVGVFIYYRFYRDWYLGINKTVGWAWDITTSFGGLVLVTQDI